MFVFVFSSLRSIGAAAPITHKRKENTKQPFIHQTAAASIKSSLLSLLHCGLFGLLPHPAQLFLLFNQLSHSEEKVEEKKRVECCAAVHSLPIAQINQFHPNKFSFIDLLLSTGQPMYDNTVIISFNPSISQLTNEKKSHFSLNEGNCEMSLRLAIRFSISISFHNFISLHFIKLFHSISMLPLLLGRRALPFRSLFRGGSGPLPLISLIIKEIHSIGAFRSFNHSIHY